jgi:hypothetical protein
MDLRFEDKEDKVLKMIQTSVAPDDIYEFALILLTMSAFTFHQLNKYANLDTLSTINPVLLKIHQNLAMIGDRVAHNDGEIIDIDDFSLID